MKEAQLLYIFKIFTEICPFLSQSKLLVCWNILSDGRRAGTDWQTRSDLPLTTLTTLSKPLYLIALETSRTADVPLRARTHLRSRHESVFSVYTGAAFPPEMFSLMHFFSWVNVHIHALKSAYMFVSLSFIRVCVCVQTHAYTCESHRNCFHSSQMVDKDGLVEIWRIIIHLPQQCLVWGKNNVSQLNILKERLPHFIIYPSKMGKRSVMSWSVLMAEPARCGFVVTWKCRCPDSPGETCPPGTFISWGFASVSKGRSDVRWRETICITLSMHIFRKQSL